jgi:hypothetical protein
MKIQMKTQAIKVLFIALCFPVAAFSQNTIKGRITDSKNARLELVTVVLLNRDSAFVQGTASGRDGAFEL